MNMWRLMAFQLFSRHLNLKGIRLRHQRFICMYCSLPNIINPMHIEQLTAVILLHSQNTVGVCKLITLTILCQVSSGLVTLLKYIYAIIQVSDINVFALCFQRINLRDMNARCVTEHKFPAVDIVVRTYPYASS